MEITSRRSTRIKTKTTSDVASDNGTPTRKVEQSDEEDEFEALEDNKKKRKAVQPRQNVKKNTESQPPAKRARMRSTRGALKQILEMPFDILYEIFVYLPPTDLLSIGRTSRDLKDLVLSTDFKAIWSRVLSATGIPPCPADMLLPEYAELAFGNTCMACGVTRQGMYRHWQIRRKVCGDCSESRSRKNCTNYRGPSAAIVSSDTLASHIYDRGFWYYETQASALYQEYRTLTTETEQSEWVEATRLRIKEIEANALECRDWNIEWVREMQREEAAEIRARKAKVIEMAKKLGWEAELSVMTGAKLENREAIEKLCRKPFNDRIIETIKVTINTTMERVKADRIDRENALALTARMKILSEAYTDALASCYPPVERHPPASDIFYVPHIKSIVCELEKTPKLMPADFKLNKKTLPDVIQEAYHIIEAKVLALVSTGLGKKNHDPDIVLDLATTLFVNPDLVFGKIPASEKAAARECSFLTVPQLLVCTSSRLSIRDRTVMEDCVYKAFGQSAWHPASTIKFHKVAHAVAVQVLRICKLNPAKATLDEVNELHPILECRTCNSTAEGRILLSWDAAVSHIIACHCKPVDSKTMVLLDGDDAEKARQVMKDRKRRSMYAEQDARGVCLHCDATGSVSALLDHIHQKHGVVAAGEEDLECAFRVQGNFHDSIGKPDGEYRMWPPHPPSMWKTT